MRAGVLVLGAAVLSIGRLSAQVPSLAPRLPVEQPGWTSPVAGFLSDSWTDSPSRIHPSLRGADSVWRREAQTGRGLKVGGIAGAMVGAGLGAAYLAAIQEVDESDGSRSTGAAVAVVGGSVVIGGVLGMGIGAAIGSLFHRWVLVSS